MKDFFLENFNAISAGFIISTAASSKFIYENIEGEQEEPKKGSFLKTALKTAGVLGAGALVGASMTNPGGFSGVMNDIGTSVQNAAPVVTNKISSIGDSIGSAANSAGDSIKSFGVSAQKMGEETMGKIKSFTSTPTTPPPTVQTPPTTPQTSAPTPQIKNVSDIPKTAVV